MKNKKVNQKQMTSKLAKFNTLQLSTTAQKQVKGGNDIIIEDIIITT